MGDRLMSHDTDMTWPYFVLRRVQAGDHEGGQHPELPVIILGYQALGSVPFSIIKTWAQEYRRESSIRFTSGHAQCLHLPSQYTERPYHVNSLGNARAIYPLTSQQNLLKFLKEQCSRDDRKMKSAIRCPKNLSMEIVTFKLI